MKLNLSLSTPDMSILVVAVAVVVIYIAAPDKADRVVRALVDLLLLSRTR